MSGLKIGTCDGRDFILPDDAAAETFAILGKRGAGKTNTAVVLVEEMLDRGNMLVIIDPVGVWWGLKSHYAILKAGGQNADIVLDPKSGSIWADYVAAERVPTILDTSRMGEGEMSRFVGEFCQTLYERQEADRKSIHVIIDECDEFAPQTDLRGNVALSLGAIQRCVRRGRARGIGFTSISQRSAALAKNVLTQTECLVAMRTTSPQDRAAIELWLKHYATDEQMKKVLSTLATLEAGEAWIYSPSWMKTLERVQIRSRRTFDSSKTPKPGQEAERPKSLKQIDLAALKGRMSELVEETKANDPQELKKRIRELEQKLATQGTGADPKELAKAVQAAKIETENMWIENLDRQRSAFDSERRELLSRIGDVIEAVKTMFMLSLPQAKSASSAVKSTAKIIIHQPIGVLTVDEETRASDRPSGKKATPHQRILDSLAWWEATNVRTVRIEKIAFMADYRPTGTFSNYLSAMVKDGLLVREPGSARLTDKGRAQAKKIARVPSLAEYHDRLFAILKSAPLIKILRTVIRLNERVSIDTLAENSGYSNTGTFSNYCSSLSSLGLVHRQGGKIWPSDLLFPANLS